MEYLRAWQSGCVSGGKRRRSAHTTANGSRYSGRNHLLQYYITLLLSHTHSSFTFYFVTPGSPFLRAVSFGVLQVS
jgi:hypothetical protein